MLVVVVLFILRLSSDSISVNLLFVDDDVFSSFVHPQGENAEEGRKGHYVGVHASGFKDFLLKAELLRALVDCGFEHPSEG